MTVNEKRKNKTMKVALVGMMAAAVYVSSAFLQIPIPTVIGSTRLHVGNVMCLLSGFLLGAVPGGSAAGLGSALFDLTSPVYLTSAPFTFVFKFFMAWLCGKIAAGKEKGHKQWRILLAAVCGAFSYVVLYLLKNFLEYYFVYGMPLQGVMVMTGQKAVVSGLNAVLAVIVAVPLSRILMPIIKKVISAP